MKIILIIFVFQITWLNAQKAELSLDDCIQLCEKNTYLSISQISTVEKNNLNIKFGKWSFLPNLNLNTGYNMSYGRKLDPFTNTFGNSSIYSNSYGISSQLTLLQGGRYFYQNNLFTFSKKMQKLT